MSIRVAAGPYSLWLLRCVGRFPLWRRATAAASAGRDLLGGSSAAGLAKLEVKRKQGSGEAEIATGAIRSGREAANANADAVADVDADAEADARLERAIEKGKVKNGWKGKAFNAKKRESWGGGSGWVVQLRGKVR
ncbi:hypothetical protein EJ05DRAFT_495281 [Pseudovirgaria hyperparasitica]|uniref:Uncharacterized protein n=1 Tax=Pseudovirgaria hyperparasitica TaxID=470096 RepID=A0A6A6WJZ1_9PEZI|nr:uncharacterized protein EJ05DRAFT_495281 [Pseudovirgaria hyperparasitica]KAF2762397.1 hypothetical protein EJ05DRAFT_495281 [Pseudovirgaria hyperparasitica]